MCYWTHATFFVRWKTRVAHVGEARHVLCWGLGVDMCWSLHLQVVNCLVSVNDHLHTDVAQPSLDG